MWRLKDWRRIFAVVIAVAVMGAVGIALYSLLAPQPAFSRERAIARAREMATQSRPEVGMTEARIDEVTAELMTMSRAYRQEGIDSTLYSDAQVWLVVVKGNFVYEGFPMPEARQFYRATRQIFIMNAATGAMDISGLKETELVGTTPNAPHATTVP